MRHATPALRRTLRTGFTLVEMLVVMALIVLLAALAAGVANSGLIGSQRLSSGSNAISGWLLIAKQTAARDGAPRGVRFFGRPDATNSYLQFTEAQYIQSADPVVFNPAQEGAPGSACIVLNVEYDPANPANLAAQSRDIYFVVPNAAQAATLIPEFDQRVAVGDYLVLPEYGVNSRISDAGIYTGTPLVVDGTPAGTPAAQIRRLTIDSLQAPITPQSALDFAAAGQPRPTPVPAARPTTIKTYKFGFQNVPRPVLGEGPLLVTGDIGIDVRVARALTPTNTPATTTADGFFASNADVPTTIGVKLKIVDPTVLPADRTYYFDIVFAPSGRVLDNTDALTCLWVRDLIKIDGSNGIPAGTNPRASSAAFDQAGEQLLTVIYNRSGLIATQPVAPPPLDPYQYAKDGANNGI